MYLALRTDSPTAQLFLLDNHGNEVVRQDWLADRQLAEGLLTRLGDLLSTAKIDWDDLTGVIVFSGPGSFTGLRIGITVANAAVYALSLPIVGERGEGWLQAGFRRIQSGGNDVQVIPNYGSAPNITKPKR